MRKIKDLINLKGRTSLVTGSCGSLGRVICDSLAEIGSDLILVDLPELDINSLANDLENDNSIKTKVFGCNLEEPKSREKLILEVLSSQKELSILVNAAALVSSNDLEGWATRIEDQSLETWNRAIEVNLSAAFDLSKGLAPKLSEKGKGSIINISSIYGVSGPDYSIYEGTNMGNPAAYAASKGGLIQLTRWLATTLASDIRVNAVSPGGILRDQPKEFVERYSKKTPLKRMAKEEDFKGVIAYLASDLSEYVTGQNILVDGGWTVW